MGLFTHTYKIALKARLTNGDIFKGKVSVEARFATGEEIVEEAKRHFNRIAYYETGHTVADWIEIYEL